MKVYLAAVYPKRDALRQIAATLRDHNIGVTSRWLDETVPLSTQLTDTLPGFCRLTAIQDLEDIDAADTFVFFAEDPTVGFPRGGRHVEFGFALAKGKRMVIIGQPENIFCYLPDVLCYATIENFLDSEAVENADVAD